MVVDTHVTRISRRLGLTQEKNAEKIEQDLMAVLPEERMDRLLASHDPSRPADLQGQKAAVRRVRHAVVLSTNRRSDLTTVVHWEPQNMILSGEMIRQKLGSDIRIDPFDPKHLNPNSYNLTLHDELMIYEEVVLDMRKREPRAAD